ncbi:MAG: hypothetical protein PW735_00225 [Acidobacteriaceae bacterium]|nr:hypothetical protein [Acidobacteriaceae bacterium]
MRRALLTLSLTLAATAACAQDGFGKLDPAPPAGITIPDLIQKMGKQESAFEEARRGYEFRQTVRMTTISDTTDKPDGEFLQVSDLTFDDSGKRIEKVVFAPQNTIERVILTENDMNDVKERLPFILTSEQLPQYTLTYAGQQKVDDLDTYVFDVAPKELVKGHRYFQGRVWLDQQDDQIVLVNGLNVPQENRPGKEDLSPPFTTYYQQVDGKYWFPTYTRAEGILHFSASNGSLSQSVHIRNTVKYTDYKKFNFRSKIRLIYNGEDLPQQPADKGSEAPKK